MGKYREIEDTCSDSVLWLKFEREAFGCELILGALYIPHEGSKYHSSEVFEDILSDCSSIQAKFQVPVCILGDFNSRTGVLDDFLDLENLLSFEAGLDASCNDFNSRQALECLGLCTKRFSMDTSTNNNGYKLIELCKTLDLHIVNGRFGNDKGIGRVTCDNTSVVDYVIVSAELFPQIVDFNVDVMDKFLSDKHRAISIKFRCKDNVPSVNSRRQASNVMHTKMVWDNEKANEFDSFFVSVILIKSWKS